MGHILSHKPCRTFPLLGWAVRLMTLALLELLCCEWLSKTDWNRRRCSLITQDEPHAGDVPVIGHEQSEDPPGYEVEVASYIQGTRWMMRTHTWRNENVETELILIKHILSEINIFTFIMSAFDSVHFPNYWISLQIKQIFYSKVEIDSGILFSCHNLV